MIFPAFSRVTIQLFKWIPLLIQETPPRSPTPNPHSWWFVPLIYGTLGGWYIDCLNHISPNLGNLLKPHETIDTSSTCLQYMAKHIWYSSSIVGLFIPAFIGQWKKDPQFVSAELR